MATLTNYQKFNGVHYETGTLHNYYDYLNVTAPHNNKPYSEALFMGVSGGITFGYFTFAYQGIDPQCNILTRNTFDPLNKILTRLGIEQNLLHTAIKEKSVTNLTNVLENGEPAIVWADKWSLPYNALPMSDQMWGAMPLIVYGYNEATDTVQIADGSQAPLTCTLDELAAARARIKKDKNRVLSLSSPNPDKLASAVKMGIWDTIKIFTEAPPKGSKNSFGLTGMQYWAKMLTQPKQKKSWEKSFPAGRKMIAGLTSAFDFSFLFAKPINFDGERKLYATFLEEAAIILGKDKLKTVAELYRNVASEWEIFSSLLLPADISQFKEMKQLMISQREYYLYEGNKDVTRAIDYRDKIEHLKQSISDSFPLTDKEVLALREALATQILVIHNLEEAAIATLKSAMS